ncbi:MAG: amidohydrolase family protein [Ilumatobacteraceae bacterium]
MHDLVIRNATLVDGTGGVRRTADIAIDGEHVSAVTDRDGSVGAGEQVGAGHREIDADGLVVTPGWVDIHTHYDGQVTWDPDLAPSSINGVTSIVTGNCGVGFAPVAPDRHQWLIELLEGVEDIPGTALAEGMTWGWESFPEYLDLLDRLRWTIDVGTQVPHAALRTYVMGDRGADVEATATPAEIAQMSSLCEAAIRAGALGFTTSRTYVHRTSRGAQIGTLRASADEVLGIAAALRRAGTGVIQLISDAYQSTDDELVAHEIELLGRIAHEVGRPLSFTVQQNDDAPDRYRELLAAIDGWNEAGADVKAQVGVRPIGVLVGLQATANPFMFCPSYRPLHTLTHDERVAHLRDPEVKRTLLEEHAASSPDGFVGILHSGYDRMYPLSDPPDYEPSPADSVAGRAATIGAQPDELLYDLLLDDDGRRLLYIPLMNYARGSLDDVREMLSSPHALFGLSDAGAHCNSICDGTFPTSAITHWTRDRSRGDRLPLEQVVHHQTQRTARHVGWLDRGVVAPGYLADLNVIDIERLALRPPALVADLPAGGTRLLQTADGYVATVKRGAVTVDRGELTGERPGRLQRGAATV